MKILYCRLIIKNKSSILVNTHTMSNYSHYTDFLKDRQFVQWQLLPDETLNTQWEDFIEKHPHLKGEISQAIDYLKTTGFNKSMLNEEERMQLFRKIQLSIERNSEKIKIQRIRYAIASCAAVVLIMIGLNLFVHPKQKAVTEFGEEQIVGNFLNDENIQLISGKEAISFQCDIKLKINEKGAMTIIQENEEEKTVDIDKASLNKLIVPYGKQMQLNLSDGTRIWLNSGSVLEFPSKFSVQSRRINLISGEIYAEVASDKTRSFYVQTSDFQIKVYGTKFNISTYSGSPQSVTLVEGSVSLQSANDNELFLSPDEQAVYTSNGVFDTQKVDVRGIISWKDGYLTLDKTPMTDVLKKIGRYYNLSFNYESDVNLQKRTCTGKINLSDNLDHVMTTIALLSSTGYEKRENIIYITNKPNKNM